MKINPQKNLHTSSSDESLNNITAVLSNPSMKPLTCVSDKYCPTCYDSGYIKEGSSQYHCNGCGSNDGYFCSNLHLTLHTNSTGHTA